MKIVQIFTSPDHRRRVEIFRRDTGTFGYREYVWPVEEESWDLIGPRSEAVIDSETRAIAEVRGRLPWVDQIITTTLVDEAG